MQEINFQLNDFYNVNYVLLKYFKQRNCYKVVKNLCFLNKTLDMEIKYI